MFEGQYSLLIWWVNSFEERYLRDERPNKDSKLKTKIAVI